MADPRPRASKTQGVPPNLLPLHLERKLLPVLADPLGGDSQDFLVPPAQAANVEVSHLPVNHGGNFDRDFAGCIRSTGKDAGAVVDLEPGGTLPQREARGV